MSQVGSNVSVNQSDAENALGKRPIKLTVKASEAKMQSNQKERNARMKKLYNLARNVKELMLSNKNVSEVQSTSEMFVRLMTETMELHESLKPLMPKEEMMKQNAWFETQMRSNREMMHTMNKWLQTTKEQFKHDDGGGNCENYDVDENALADAATNTTMVVDDIDPNDSISNVGDRTCSSAGRSSRRSSKSTISSSCLKAEAEVAALNAMAAALQESHALKAQEEQIRQRREMLELQSKIAAHTAKVDVLRYRGSDVQSSRAHSDGMNSYLESSKGKPSLRPSAKEFVPQHQKHHCNHLPIGGSKPTLSTETQQKITSQFHTQPVGGSKAAMTKGTQLSGSTAQFQHLAAGVSKAVMSTGARPKDLKDQFHYSSVGGSKLTSSMEEATKETALQIGDLRMSPICHKNGNRHVALENTIR